MQTSILRRKYMKQLTAQEIKTVMVTANKAKTKWKELPLEKRVKAVQGLHDAIEKNAEEIAKLISEEMGKPISESRGEVKGALDELKWGMANASKYLSDTITFENEKEKHVVQKTPRGIAISITPYNYPLIQAIRHINPMLLSGNVIISKPAGVTPKFTTLMQQVVKQSKLPEGVLQFVLADRIVGDLLLQEKFDILAFTGSTYVGRQLSKLAGEKMIPSLLELGGSAPVVVFDDADLDGAAKAIYGNRFKTAGQICSAMKRAIVHEKVAKALTAKLVEIINKQVIGEPLDEKTTFAGLVSQKALDEALAHLDDAIKKGAKVEVGGKVVEGLKFTLEPTVLTNIKKDMRVWQEETFSPILPIVTFKTIDEAINLANDTEYGLTSYVFTKNAKTFEKVANGIEAGGVAQNGLAVSKAFNPLIGWKNSGNGFANRGEYGFITATTPKVVVTSK
jgi:succinate-semialdehyde dehydrogenase/glutarate-semialdehyde dehydrogenase